MSSPKLSVIVPVYNVGTYLRRCADSILNQSEKDLELILVNDGSTDGSKEICDEYAARDPRVRVIHKKNEGVSCARNKGIQASNGEFIAFADADDYMDQHMYARLLEEQERTGFDVVYCGFQRIYNDRSEEETFPERRDYSKDEVHHFAEDMFKTKVFGAVWRSIYSKSAIADVRFDPQISYAEDLLFNLEVLKNVNGLCVIPDALYYYNKANESGICNKTEKDPDFRYTASLQRQLQLNEYWKFPIEYDAFYKVYVDMMFQFLVRKLEEGDNEELVERYLTEGFFAQCCHYDKQVPLRRRIVCILIRKRWFRLAVFVRKTEDAALKAIGR